MKKGLFRSIILGLVSIMLASCGGGGTSEEKEFVQYIEKAEARLTLDYKDRDFYADGISQVTLVTPIDGDTAHFKMADTSKSQRTIKGRFYGIDTPESTGDIQPWGKPASNFTSEKLKTANANGTIVLSTGRLDYGSPETDSTGARYVTIVWVNLEEKNCDYQDLLMLNLWIVQEGYSNVKNVSAIPAYSQIYLDAEAQAKDFKLNMFSDEADPYIDLGGYKDTSLLDIKMEIEAQFADPTHVNKYNNTNVRILGTVAGYADNVLYIQNYYSPENGGRGENGEYAGINVFCGMSAIPSKFSEIGAYLEICGVASDSETFGFQISSAKFPYVSSGQDGEAQVLIPAADNTDEFKLNVTEFATASALGEKNFDVLYTRVKIDEPVEVTRFYKPEDSNEITLNLKDIPFTVYITFVFKNPDNRLETWGTAEDFVGHTFNLSGVYGFHKFSSGSITWQIVLCSNADFVRVS